LHHARYKEWLENEYFDEKTRHELKNLVDPREIEDRFYTDLEFGTAGMRGVMGAGTNRMNIYVVRRAAQGLADYILGLGQENATRGVVIAYDSRKFSQEFALEAALVLVKNNIKAYLFKEMRPTPELSFAVRHLNAIAGIVITASHNPKEYNGFKVYWEDGGQAPPKRSDAIYHHIKRYDTVVGITPAKKAQAIKSGLLFELGEEIDTAYLNRVKSLIRNQSLISTRGGQLHIVYTPLHGTGIKLIPRLLDELGFSSTAIVKEQAHPDPEFSTVIYPNPELDEAFVLAKTYAEKTDADIILATDPDTDRLGVMVKQSAKVYKKLSGNQIGVLLLYYLLSQQKTACARTKWAVIKTIASTELADNIAHRMGAQVYNVLTGFKFIAEKMQAIEEEGKEKFLFGFEESNGYLAGDFVRDKDAVIASALIAEAALYYKETQNKSLLDVLEDIYAQFGYYIEDQISVTLKGKEGSEKIAQIMTWLRQTPIKKLGSHEIAAIEDYLNAHTGLPKSNVIRYMLREGGFVMARPSGTEPKIKFYFLVKASDRNQAEQIMEDVKNSFLQPLKQEFKF